MDQQQSIMVMDQTSPTYPAAGLTTEALVSSGIVTTLNLTAAQDHKVTASGITTITCIWWNRSR